MSVESSALDVERFAPHRAIFLSYARDDAGAARRIAEALRASGLEVWFDENELRGGDTWDAKIRKQIDACTLFIPVVSQHTQDRSKGYFRLEWKLAVDQTHLLAEGVPFLAPVVIDETRESDAVVPPEFMKVQWTRLPGALPTPQFVEQVKRLLDRKAASVRSTPPMVAGRPRPGDSASPETGSPKKSIPGWTWGALTAVVVGVGVALVVSRKPEPVTSAAVAPEAARRSAPPTSVPVAPVNNKSLAVLPFENLSPDKEDEFFASGMHEEMLTAMQTLQDLRVIQYRGANKSVRQIGEELHVAFVLECSVRRSGNQVRVTGKLTHARTEELAWAEKFEGELTDVFAIQAQLAKAIAGKLSAVISPVERSVIERRPTTNVAAYDLYLKAKDVRSRSYNSPTFIRQGEALLLSAVALDPQFALAWSDLAWTQAYLYSGIDRTEERLAKARQALAKTKELAPDAAETLRTEGNFYYFTARDYPRAMEFFIRSLALRPNDPESYLSLAQVQRREGKWAESVANYQRALALNPQDDRYLRNLAQTLDFCRHYDAAIALQRRRVTQDIQVTLGSFRARGSTAEGDSAAKNWSPRAQLSWAFAKGDFQEVVRHENAFALSLGYFPGARSLRGLGKETEARQKVADFTEQLQASLVTRPDSAGLWMRLALVHSLSGRHQEALTCGRKAVELLPESGDAMSGPAMSADLAEIEAWAGYTDVALSQYARLLRNGGANVHELRAAPLPAALKQDKRFQALLADPKNNEPLF